VNREMALMADALANHPDDLADLAAACVADAPQI